VRILPEAIDLRSFYAYTDRQTRLSDDPLAHFARLGCSSRRWVTPPPQGKICAPAWGPLPAPERYSSRLPDAGAAHLCPLDFLTHTLLPAILRQSGFTTLTMTLADDEPHLWNDVPALVNGLTAFCRRGGNTFRSTAQRRPVEMAEALAVYDCSSGERCAERQLLYDLAPARAGRSRLPGALADPPGRGRLRGGQAGYRRGDPLAPPERQHLGLLAVEGHGPFYAMDALPGLARARLEALREAVRKI
jgi:hypothetical protein